MPAFLDLAQLHKVLSQLNRVNSLIQTGWCRSIGIELLGMFSVSLSAVPTENVWKNQRYVLFFRTMCQKRLHWGDLSPLQMYILDQVH